MAEYPLVMSETADRGRPNQPLLQSAYDYWMGKRADRFAPSRADIKPEEIRFLLPHVMILDVIGVLPRFRYHLVGTSFSTEYGAEITGKFTDEIDLSVQKAAIIADYSKVARTGAPSSSDWTYTKFDGRTIECERVVLPLSADGHVVNMLFVAFTAHGVPTYPVTDGRPPKLACSRLSGGAPHAQRCGGSTR